MTRGIRFLQGVFAAAVLLASTAACHAGGVSIFPLVYGLDVEETLAGVPAAVDAAVAAFADTLVEEGLPEAVVNDMMAALGGRIADLEAGISGLPTVCPVPLLGGSLELAIPLIVVDGVRLAVAGISDGIVRDVAALVGFEVPSPLFDVAFDTDGEHFAFTGDVAFTSWLAVTEGVKRFDLLLAALELGTGVAWIQGSVTPLLAINAPSEYEAALESALDALALDEISWSTFALSGSVGLELGLPFLRIQARMYGLIPISQSTGQWLIRTARWSMSIGLGVRF